MKFKVHSVVALAVVGALTGFAWGAPQSQESTLDTKINFKVKDADLHHALEVLSANTGLQFVYAPGGQEAGNINLRLDDKPVSEVLDYVCQAAGCRAVRDDNGVYVIYLPGSEVKEKVNKEPTSAKTFIRKIKVMHENPKQLLAKINGTSLELTDDNPNNPGQPTGYSQIQSANPIYNSAQEALESNGPRKASDASNFQRGFAGGQGQQTGGGVNGQGNGGVNGGGGGGGFSGLQPARGNFVPQGTTKLMYDPTDNSLIFQGTQEAYRQLLEILAAFDVAPKQVQVKFEFVTYSKNRNSSFGIDWLYERGGVFFGATPGSFARSSDQIFFNWATGNVSSRLRTQLLQGNGTTISAPLVRTLNNQLGQVAFTTTISIFQTSISQGAGGNVSTTTVQQLPITSQIRVRPRVNGDGTITMGLAPTITNLGQLRRGPDGQEIPDQISQTASVIAIVRDRETIAIGGLTQKSSTGTSARIPLLSDLPVIGQLFRSRTENQDDSELIIFVTPTIVTADDAGLGIS